MTICKIGPFSTTTNNNSTTTTTTINITTKINEQKSHPNNNNNDNNDNNDNNNPVILMSDFWSPPNNSFTIPLFGRLPYWREPQPYWYYIYQFFQNNIDTLFNSPPRVQSMTDNDSYYQLVQNFSGKFGND
jgi:hypothetical protein